MASKLRNVKVKLNKRVVKSLLKNPNVLTYVTKKALKMHKEVGGSAAGYDVLSGLGRNRARAAVVAYTYEARRDNARRNTLINAIDSARGDDI